MGRLVADENGAPALRSGDTLDLTATIPMPEGQVEIGRLTLEIADIVAPATASVVTVVESLAGDEGRGVSLLITQDWRAQRNEDANYYVIEIFI